MLRLLGDYFPIVLLVVIFLSATLGILSGVDEFLYIAYAISIYFAAPAIIMAFFILFIIVTSFFLKDVE